MYSWYSWVISTIFWIPGRHRTNSSFLLMKITIVLVFIICISLHVLLRITLERKHSIVEDSLLNPLFTLPNSALHSGISFIAQGQGYAVRRRPHDTDLPNATMCVVADTLFPGRPLSGASAMEAHEERPLPFVGTNVDYDVMGWTERLFDGLDFPVVHKLLAAGGCESDVLQQVGSLQAKHPDLHVFRTVQPMGCAPGWNKILHYMDQHDDIPFAFIFNNDIYTPPGALRNLSREMWDVYEQDPMLCIAHMRDWTAFAMTKRALRVLGFFDENIYPAFWEDDDINIRLDRAMRAGHCSPIQDLASATLQHNHNDGYVSGNVIQVQKLMDSNADIDLKRKWNILSERWGKGYLENEKYFKKKWGCPDIPPKEGQGWKDICPFQTPFQQPDVSLSWWVFDHQRRRCIDKEPSVEACSYILAV